MLQKQQPVTQAPTCAIRLIPTKPALPTHLFCSPGWPEVRLPSRPILCYQQLPTLPALWAVQHLFDALASPVGLGC